MLPGPRMTQFLTGINWAASGLRAPRWTVRSTGVTARASSAGAPAAAPRVLPGENGTVLIGAHTGTYFSDLGSVQLGAMIHLETDWGDFTYQVTDMQVILETDIDKVRLGATEPSVILYTCYPFGILTHTTQRYAVYADPVSADASGVIPADTAE